MKIFYFEKKIEQLEFQLEQLTLVIGCLVTSVHGIKKIMNYAVSIVHDFYKVKEVVSENASSE